MSGQPSLQDMNRELVGRVRSLCRDLLPQGRERAGEWVEAGTRQGGLGDSLSVRVSGSKAGIWAHFAAGKAGDLLDLIAYLQTGGDMGAAVRWARQWLGHDASASVDRAELDRRRAEAAERAERARADDLARRDRVRAFAQRLWLSGAPVESGDPVARYLARRGVGLDALGRRPNFMRCGHGIRHESGSRWPAMLSCIVGLDGAFMGVHRTYLTEDGRKAPVEPAKSVLGAIIGGHVPVWKGLHRRPLADVPEGVRLFISEGIEDALTVARMLPAARVVAAVSIGNIARIALPPQVRDVTIVADNDPETLPDGRPHPAFVAIRDAAAAHRAAGRQVRIARAAPPHKDFNAWLMAVAHG